MTVIAGPVQDITIDGRRFSVTADNDTERDLGGFTNETLMNSDSSSRKKKTRRPWKLSGLAVEVSDMRGDQEFLRDKEAQQDNYPITATFANGITYTATGTIEGEVKFKSGSATAELSLSGGGELDQQ